MGYAAAALGIVALGIVALIVFAVVLQRKKRKANKQPTTVLVTRKSSAMEKAEPDALAITFPGGKTYLGVTYVSLPLLLGDADEDRPVRVVIHELLHCLQLGRGEPMSHSPKGGDIGWYLVDADSTKAPLAPFVEAEVAWIKAAPKVLDVKVDPEQVAWLEPWVVAAMSRINAAAGRIILRRG